MESWRALELGDLLSAQLTLDRLRDAIASDGGPSAAIFTRRRSGELHCEVTAYFSPGAAGIAEREGAERCPSPGRRGLELLAGPDTSWDLFDA